MWKASKPKQCISYFPSIQTTNTTYVFSCVSFCRSQKSYVYLLSVLLVVWSCCQSTPQQSWLEYLLRWTRGKELHCLHLQYKSEILSWYYHMLSADPKNISKNNKHEFLLVNCLCAFSLNHMTMWVLMTRALTGVCLEHGDGVISKNFEHWWVGIASAIRLFYQEWPIHVADICSLSLTDHVTVVRLSIVV